MSDTPETLDAILAEMRDFCSGWSEDVDVTVKVGLIYGWMCRIEAAVARERNAHVNDVHDALYMATGIPGDAAAMRSALEKISNMADLYPRIPRSAFANTARAALAAPARNCDRFATAEDAFKAWESDNKKPPEQCFLQWLFAPAEGGKE